MVAKIKFSQPSHYDIYYRNSPAKVKGVVAIFWGEFLVPKITSFDGGLVFGGVVFEEVAVGDRL